MKATKTILGVLVGVIGAYVIMWVLSDTTVGHLMMGLGIFAYLALAFVCACAFTATALLRRH